MASPAAVANRRACRAARRAVIEFREVGRLSHDVWSGPTEVSRRIRRLIREVTMPLFDCGVIALRYMGVRFVELFYLGWTPARYVLVGDRLVMRGRWCSDGEFEKVWAWWVRIGPAARGCVLRLSRGLD